jgi:hypothetical protein
MDVKVNKSEWEGVTAEDRKKIEQIISSHFKEARIVPDAGAGAAKTLLANRKMPMKFSICSAACGVAEAGAVAACVLLGNPIAIAVCVAAAHEAGNWCRDQCPT